MKDRFTDRPHGSAYGELMAFSALGVAGVVTVFLAMWSISDSAAKWDRVATITSSATAVVERIEANSQPTMASSDRGQLIPANPPSAAATNAARTTSAMTITTQGGLWIRLAAPLTLLQYGALHLLSSAVTDS